MSQGQAIFDTTVRIGRERDQTTEVLIERWQTLNDERARDELVRRFVADVKKRGLPVRQLELRAQDGRMLGPEDTIVRPIADEHRGRGPAPSMPKS